MNKTVQSYFSMYLSQTTAGWPMCDMTSISPACSFSNNLFLQHCHLNTTFIFSSQNLRNWYDEGIFFAFVTGPCNAMRVLMKLDSRKKYCSKCTLDCTQEMGKCQIYFQGQTCNTFNSLTFWHNMRTTVIKAVLKTTTVGNTKCISCI